MWSTVHGRDNHSCSPKLLNSSAVLPSLLLLAFVFAWDMCSAGAFPLTNNRWSGELCMLLNSWVCLCCSVEICQFPRYQKQQNRTQFRGICLIDGHTPAAGNGCLSAPGAPYPWHFTWCLNTVFSYYFLKSCLSKTDFEADVWETRCWSQLLDT